MAQFQCALHCNCNAAFRSVVNTAKANPVSVLNVRRLVLAAGLLVEPLTEAG